MSEKTRLNKFISEAGVASRRAADKLIEERRVTINGRVAVVGDKVKEGDIVAVDGKRIEKEEGEGEGDGYRDDDSDRRGGEWGRLVGGRDC